MSFEQTALNEFITLQRGFDLPKGDRAEGAIPVIASTGVGGYHNIAKVEAPGVVIGRSGSIGGGQYIQEAFWPLNTTLWVKDFKGHDPRYIYYLMRSIDFTKFNVGSGVPTLNRNHLSSLLVNEIGIDREKTIAKLLGDLDDKIAFNTQTNQTLEQMAQAIFKSWFVDFDPVKAKMRGEQPEGMDDATASLFPEKLVSDTGLPEGWIKSEIGDEVTVVGGGTPSKKNDDFWVDGDIHWTSPKDLSGVQDKVLLDTASKVTEAGLRKISSGLLPIDTVLLSSRAPVGYLALAKVPMAINQGYIAMKCEKVLPPEFVLQWCVHRMDEIKQRASGSTFAEISKKNFKPISVVVPSEEVLTAYQKLVKPLYDAITSNIRQSEQLSTLRDTLLPKLLSGQLDLERN
ncbi:restriction endonuclease subunit S [Vibrio casei]|uniref:Restriction endonuclease subunit S n=1 Tax=Vibrio casei TaxID=673372 RepID=A0A368LMF5_9VIBR|nr:restriction endonuclease subunit S [Vibrio casei]RCS73062.1 restriction endonuclease subunit S [Vibrio casei]SJN40644.1 Type I restriction-modification system, specificity subunit S [Vibrio casei]